MITKIKKLYIYIFSFAVPVVMLYIIWSKSNIFPFGEISNLRGDLSIQYVDLYSYLQNVFQGKAGLDYTFTKPLGGGAIALYAYYLASPINLLLIFFQKNLQLFVYIASAIKLGLCGVFETFYLRKRFSELKESEVLLLSMCFAVSYYSILQIQNLMWMDGVYLLPLIMYGVWDRLEHNKSYCLIFTVSASILFNWYTGYMNCLFAILYFMFELLKKDKLKKKDYYLAALQFAFSMFLGILLSSILFLPNIYGLLQGKGGIKENIWQWQSNGNIFNVLRGTVIGNDFSSNNLSLFCGTIVILMATLGIVNLYKKEKRPFIISIIFLSIMILSLLVKPLENIWNGFRFATSYMYRFSYLHIWLLIYFAAVGFTKALSNIKIIYKISLVYVCIWSLCDYIVPFDSKMLYFSFTSIGILSIACLWRNSVSQQIRNIAGISIGIITLLELIMNGIVVAKATYNWQDYSVYKNYVPEQKKLVESIKKNDTEKFYRIEQTCNIEHKKNKCTPYFLENMAYNYNGFSHYSSTFNENVRSLGECLGYGKNDTVSMYDEPILTSDSILGIKYVMADRQYPQLRLTSDLEINGKKVYENPYALPLGFSVSENSLQTIYSENHFEFQNELFSNLIGQQIEVYKPARTQIVECNNNHIIFEVEAAENNILYGYANSNIGELQLFIDDEYRCDYETWLSYKVFNISEVPGRHLVRFENFRGNEDQISTQFYELDLLAFQDVITKLKKQSINVIDFQDGHVEATIDMEFDGRVLLTIPIEKGWQIRVNEEIIEPFTGINTFVTIPVKKGKNIIVMDYKVPYLGIGITISLGTFIMIIVYAFLLKYRQSKKFAKHFWIVLQMKKG